MKYGPVTPAMVRGWAPKTENTKAAMKDDIKTSETPYWLVVSMRSREKAIPGNTLCSVSDVLFSLCHKLTWQKI
jgi:hypothetical protein